MIRNILFAPVLLLAVPALADEQVPASQAEQVDYAGFALLTEEVATLRAERLLTKDEFFARASADGALLLDTRSAAAFAQGHIKGAVNLPFSDFTADKLAKVIGDTDRPIYIYCNNNFSDDVVPVRTKMATLALNIPTFINLVGYGYSNVWELSGTMPMAEADWVSAEAG
ncbi:rhodanese-like domain-containing protein [uncultured Erythrobacter sp.]|uniref:rhodanese-like domain-containing protein n=1 Tax=uncultured Erythrobacter sp. TaxID=263913 RepID=UPI00261D50FB|nr:rhodanese-like domain-containing protein [uncultured Erythrobacter sp.]